MKEKNNNSIVIDITITKNGEKTNETNANTEALLGERKRWKN